MTLGVGECVLRWTRSGDGCLFSLKICHQSAFNGDDLFHLRIPPQNDCCALLSAVSNVFLTSSRLCIRILARVRILGSVLT